MEDLLEAVEAQEVSKKTSKPNIKNEIDKNNKNIKKKFDKNNILIDNMNIQNNR